MGLSTGRTLKSGGVSTAFTNEPTTKLTANTVYQITDSTKRLLDPTTAVTVEVDADGPGGGAYVVANPSTYVFDYMFGKVFFLSDQGSAALVRVTGFYLPTVAFARVTDSSMSIARDIPEGTTHDSGGYKERYATEVDVSGSITSLELAQYDHDPGAGVLKIQTLLTSGAAFLFEDIANGLSLRAWVVATGSDTKGSGADLNSLTLNFAGAAQRAGPGGTTIAGIAWGP